MSKRKTAIKAMAALEKISAERKLRLTPIRWKILGLMHNLGKAMGAYELLAELQKREPGFKPITVYRTLEFLLQNHFIHRIESSSAYIICKQPDAHHQSQLLICDNCGYVAEIDVSVIAKKLNAKAQTAGFSRIRQIVEAHGFCKTCGDAA